MRPSFARRAVALGAAAVVSAGLVAGCASKDDGDSDNSGPGSGDNGRSSSSSSTLGAQKVDLTNTIGEVGTYDVPGSSKDTVEVGVLGLEIDGKVQVLSLVFTPHFASRSESISLWEMLGGNGFGPQLIDRTNLKIYSTLRDAYSSGVETANEKPVYVYAVFARPEDDTMDFDLQITDSWPPISVRAEEKK